MNKSGSANSNYKHGEKGTKLYRVWEQMRGRCQNKNNKNYKNYGGRGVSVCDEWMEYTNFQKWAHENGYKENLSIDRIDNDGGYNPNNCRWATVKEQNNNQRNTIRIEYKGEVKTLHEWCESLNLPVSRTYYRLRGGLTAKQAFELTPKEVMQVKRWKNPNAPKGASHD